MKTAYSHYFSYNKMVIYAVKLWKGQNSTVKPVFQLFIWFMDNINIKFSEPTLCVKNRLKYTSNCSQKNHNFFFCYKSQVSLQNVQGAQVWSMCVSNQMWQARNCNEIWELQQRLTVKFCVKFCINYSFKSGLSSEGRDST